MNDTCRQCVIGKRSTIVRSLKLRDDISVFASESLEEVDFSLYDFVWLFSWFSGQLDKNLEIIAKIPAKKLVFVSTQSVAASFIADQPFNYINHKLHCEKVVERAGGTVLRIASVDAILAKKYGPFSVAATSIDELSAFINSYSGEEGPTIHFYNIIGWDRKSLSGRLTSIVDWLRKAKFINLLHAITCKLLKRRSYGYSRDCQRILADTIVVGFGALSGFALAGKIKQSDRVFVNYERDLRLDEFGFKQSFVGLSKFGLGSKWHGVRTALDASGRVRKSVDLFPFRSSNKQWTTKLCERKVAKIKFAQKKWIVTVRKQDGSLEEHVANRLILAAGWLENYRLLSCLCEGQLRSYFSDDELVFVGTVCKTDAIEKGLIKSYGPVIKFQTGVLLSDDISFVESRLGGGQTTPESDDRLEPWKSVWRSIRGFDLQKINSKFFNKFGIGIFLEERLDLLYTTLSERCISVTVEDGELKSMHRARRVEARKASINNELRALFPTFIPYEQPLTILDGLHVTGGDEVLESDQIRELTRNKKLLVLGPPCSHKDDPFHTTKPLQDRALEYAETFIQDAPKIEDGN